MTLAVQIAGLAAYCAAAAPAPELPDLIRFKNGGMIRGTITELTPGEKVEITTAAGEQRRFKMSEVEYAGPASQAPQPKPLPAVPASPPASAPAPVHAVSEIVPQTRSEPRLTLSVSGSEPGLQLHERIGTSVAALTGPGVPWGTTARGASFRDLCTMPCSISLAPGRYTLALSKGRGDPVAGAPVALLPESREIQATLVSRDGTRTAGWLLIGAAVIGGTAMMLASSSNHSSGVGLNTGLLMAGCGVGAGGALVGYLLTQTGDDAEFAVR